MSWEIVSSIFTAIATIFGGLYWLMKINYKQQKEIGRLKRGAQLSGIEELKSLTNSFVNQLNSMKKDLSRTNDINALTQRTGLKVMHSLESYMHQNENRLKVIEQDISDINGYINHKGRL